MADTPSEPPALGTPTQEVTTTPVVVKKYANRRLYNTETSSYITLDNLADMIRAGRDFIVYDAKSGEDITRGVLTQIIVEEESKGSAMLPTAFLRQLIGFYGGNLQGVVPRYLEYSMSTFARQQQQMRQVVERTFSPFLPVGVEELSRQNMALFERAFSMWNPFHRSADQPSEAPIESPSMESSDEVERLRSEIDSLRSQLAEARAAAIAPANDVAVPANAPENVVSDRSNDLGNDLEVGHEVGHDSGNSAPNGAAKALRRNARAKSVGDPV